jgi:very-short-patch-repair endonuclease
LRKAMIEPEIMLSSRLRGRGLDRPIFPRQVAYNSMIFDFCCPAARLALEIVGGIRWDEDRCEGQGARRLAGEARNRRVAGPGRRGLP